MTLHYEFPHDIRLDEVREIVAENHNFVLADKGDYIVVDYVRAGKETHPPVVDRKTAIMRELRGLVFHPDGHVISRRYQKFFNLGEREDVMNIDVSKPHVTLNKLDGSMITPIVIRDSVRWGTKMGLTEIGMQAEVFVALRDNYTALARKMTDYGYTPIFEWCSRQNKIIIDHPQEELVLVAVRHNTRGSYLEHPIVTAIGAMCGVPVVEAFWPIKNIDKFVEELRKQEGTEGVVLRFDDGHMVKIKTDWYVALHRAKSLLDNERDVVGLIIDCKTDDLLPLLCEEDRGNLERFSDEVWGDIYDFIQRVNDTHERCAHMDKKTFATTVTDVTWAERTFCFNTWDTRRCHVDQVTDFIRKHLGSKSSYEKCLGILKSALWRIPVIEE